MSFKLRHYAAGRTSTNPRRQTVECELLEARQASPRRDSQKPIFGGSLRQSSESEGTALGAASHGKATALMGGLAQLFVKTVGWRSRLQR
jgi:hypothetical protein